MAKSGHSPRSQLVMGCIVSPKMTCGGPSPSTSAYDRIGNKCLYRGNQIKTRSVWWPLIICLVSYKKGAFRHRHTQGEEDVKAQGKNAG